MHRSICSLLNRPLPAFSRSQLAVFLALGLALFTLAGALCANRWQHRSGQPLATLGFGYGVLIDAIDHTGHYRVCNVHYPGIAFSAHRLPLIPGFLMAVRSFCGDDQARVGVGKAFAWNVLFFAAAWMVIAALPRPTIGAAALLLFPLCLPFWDLLVFEIDVEEAYLIPVLTVLFSALWFSPGLWERRLGVTFCVGLLAASLILLKHSMPFWSIAVAAVVGIRANSWRSAALVFLVVVASMLGLACFNEQVSGRFTVGSSWEGWNLYKGNNPETSRLYPWRSLDTLDYEGKVIADRPLRDEWDHNTYFENKAWTYIKAFPGMFLRNTLTKAWVFFFEVRRTGMSQGQVDEHPLIRRFQSVMMVFFRLALWTAIFAAVQTTFARSLPLADRAVPASFLLFIVLYAGFHLVGFAYERHVMPVVTPTVLFLCWRFCRQRESTA